MLLYGNFLLHNLYNNRIIILLLLIIIKYLVNDVNSSDLVSVPRWEKFLEILSQLGNEKIFSLYFINSKYNF